MNFMDQSGQGQNPIVSVLMTAFNREKYVAEAVESVLSSTLKNFELIVVDDCSSDSTVEIVRSYAARDPRVKLFINEKNLGDYPNRNRAASLAAGKYIKYLDSDDVMYSYTLQIMVDYMEHFPEAGFGLSAQHDTKPYPIILTPHQAYLEHFRTYGHFDRAPGSSIIRRDAFNDVGGFTGERFVGDTSLWFTLGRKYAMVKIPPNLTWNREHPHQESKYEMQQARQINQQREKFVLSSLMHPQCPLSDEEKQAILRQMKKAKKKENIYRYVKKLMP
jgi:glycosyltransferase involved in cell wall biosynthesis